MHAQCVFRPPTRGVGWGRPVVACAEVRAQRRRGGWTCCRCLSWLPHSGQVRAVAGCGAGPGRLTWLLSGVGWAEAAGRPGRSSQEQHALVAGGPADCGHVCSRIPFTCLALAAGSHGYCLWYWHCFTPGEIPACPLPCQITRWTLPIVARRSWSFISLVCRTETFARMTNQRPLSPCTSGQDTWRPPCSLLFKMLLKGEAEKLQKQLVRFQQHAAVEAVLWSCFVSQFVDVKTVCISISYDD